MSSNTIINGDVNSPLTFSSPITTTIESGLLTINSNIVSSNTVTCNNIMNSSSDSGNIIFNANTIMIKDGIYPTNTNTSSSYSGNINVNANTIIIGNTIGNAQVNGDLSIQNNINSLSNNTVTINANLKVVGNITTQLSINNNLLVSGDVNISGGINFNDNTRQTTAFKTLSPNPSNTYINPSSIVINDKGQVTSATAGTALIPGSYTNTSITVGTNGQISLIGNGASSSGGGGGGGSATVMYTGSLPYKIPDDLGTDVILYIKITAAGSNNAVILPNGVVNGLLKISLIGAPSNISIKLYGPPSQYYTGQFMTWRKVESSYTEFTTSCDLLLSDQLNFSIIDYAGLKIWALYSQLSRPLYSFKPETYFSSNLTIDEIGCRIDKSYKFTYNYTNFIETLSGTYNFADVYMYRKIDFGITNMFYMNRGLWTIGWEWRIWDQTGTLNKNCNIFLGVHVFNPSEMIRTTFSNGCTLDGHDAGIPPGCYYMGNYNTTPLNVPGSFHSYASYTGNVVFNANSGTDFFPFIALGNQARFGNITIVNRYTFIRIG